ncbi:DUF3611 family protein [Richelia intracellularis]|jgi:hypothetical protein|uniref:DUF3611 family protein n=1 Tax=Richelia intracellularis TaxID=1164990 RepID=UPI0005C7C9D7|nr:DUF3611 family protein [Richelia intracellularis]HAE06449.1 DUF3611 domain-containing protein [Richelia sp.]
MTDKTDSQSYSRLAIARIFSFVGWVSFWTQLLLGVVATGIFLGFKIQRSGNQIGNPGSGFGVFFAALGLLSLAGGVVVAFRYTRIGKKLASSNYSNHPRRIETLNVIRMGFMVNLIGMLLTLFGAQAISGSLLLKALSVPQGAVGFSPEQLSRLVQPIDVLVVQANINTVTAHFSGFVGSLWLFNRIHK